MSISTTLSTVTAIDSFLAEDLQPTDLIDTFCSSSAKSAKPRKMSSQGFLQKFFFRQPTLPKVVSEDQHIFTRSNNDDDVTYTDFEALPCPYIRPLGKRVEPRVENAPIKLVGFAISTSRREVENPLGPGSCMALDQISVKSCDIISALNVSSRQSSMSKEEIALAAAPDARSLSGWECYLKCYSEGRYSLNMPPSPPPKKSNFIYLPSTYPPNETERLTASQSSTIWSGTDVVWSGLQIERARSLIMAATTKFELPSAAISFFDRDFEIIQAERGYRRHLIPRYESIASHVLLKDKVMTILDAQNDWRFVGNPLVVDNPKIRFFAGAPLLSANNQVIGVFAVFGPEPRSSFNAEQKRHLVSLSQIAARDLTTSRQVSSGISSRNSLCSKQVVSYDTAILQTSSLSPPSSIKLERKKYSSEALRYHEKSQSAIKTPRVIINSRIRYANTGSLEHTPPCSDNSDTNDLQELMQGSSKDAHDEHSPPATFSTELPNNIGTPDSPTCGTLSPKFCPLHQKGLLYSEPDSLKQESCRLRSTSIGVNDNIKIMMETRRASETSPSNEALIMASDPDSSIDHFSDRSSLSVDSEELQNLLEEGTPVDEEDEVASVNDYGLSWPTPTKIRKSPRSSLNYEAVHGNLSKDVKNLSTFDPLSPCILKVNDVQAEARFAAELWAKNLAFDAIYAVELIPTRRLSVKSELESPKFIKIRILVAYGLPDLIRFDIQIHLNVLRGSGAITWGNKYATCEEYSRGFMMRLPFEPGVLDTHSHGVVFGAFRRKADSIEDLPNFRSADIERLQRAAGVLKDILSKAPWLKRSSQDKVVQLPNANSQPYLANEATEMDTIFPNEKIQIVQ